MMIIMSLGVPAWRYVMQNAREEELIFRGSQIVDAIKRYQKRHGNALPVSARRFVEGRFLRKAYKDPMTPPGEWRFIRPETPNQAWSSVSSSCHNRLSHDLGWTLHRPAP